MKSSEIDVENPVAVCQNFSAELGENGQVIVAASEVDGGSSDNSGSFTLSLDNNSFDCSDIGANTVILTVTDPSGNTDTCSTTITVEDNTAPTITCLSNQETEVDSGQTYYTLPNYITSGEVTVNDNCTANPATTQDPIAGTQLAIGVHTITFESTDDEGNVSECSFNVNVAEELANEDFEFANGLSIYPNPGNDFITLDSKNKIITSVIVYDISGKKLLSESGLSSLTHTVNVSSFTNGIYFVRINNLVTKKIVKD
ncbi:MAG: HYR domain-containing protein [Flavobacteriaceae bacterium]